MKSVTIPDLLHKIEKESEYCALLKDRYVNEQKYMHNLTLIKQGLSALSINENAVKAFENKHPMIIYLGSRLSDYEGYELPLYLAYRKNGTPVPAGLAEKCSPAIVRIIDMLDNRQNISDYAKELKERALTVDIFLAIHRSLMGSRVEFFLPGLLNDVDRLGLTCMKDALDKIPSEYFEYLSMNSIGRLIKRISGVLADKIRKLEQEQKEISLYSIRLKEQLLGLYVEAEKGLKEIIQQDVEKNADIEEIIQKTANLFSRLDRLFLGNIHHLKEYEARYNEISRSLRQADELHRFAENKAADRRKKIEDLFCDFMFFTRHGPLSGEEEKLFSRNLVQEFENMHRQKNPSAAMLKSFEKRSLLSVEIDFGLIRNTYELVMRDLVLPKYLGMCFLEMVTCVPPDQHQPTRVIADMAHLIALCAQGNHILTIPKDDSSTQKEIIDYVEAHRKCVSILVYDIRGSSYMGIKLNNASKEQRIKNKFTKEMADIVKRYGGFLLKDTGDGGLVWFADNSASLYNHLYTESVTGRGIKLRYSIFSGAEFDLIPSGDAAKRAILCARDMVLRAEEFIRANFMHYREWFAEVAERTLELDGITYALLPPEFKSLFRIGIGIASGRPGQDVVFAANSYGDPDLVGPIIADANLYSYERQPGRSVIICDSSSLINLILNAEFFEYTIDEKDFEMYLSAIAESQRGNHGYKLADHKLSIIPRGIHYQEELNKSKAIVMSDLSEVLLHENRMFSPQHKKMKMVYEVTTL